MFPKTLAITKYQNIDNKKNTSKANRKYTKNYLSSLSSSSKDKQKAKAINATSFSIISVHLMYVCDTFLAKIKQKVNRLNVSYICMYCLNK